MKQPAEWFEHHQVTPKTAVWINATETTPTQYIVKGDLVCFDTTKTLPTKGKFYLTAGGAIVDTQTAISSQAKLIGECFYREDGVCEHLAA